MKRVFMLTESNSRGIEASENEFIRSLASRFERGS